MTKLNIAVSLLIFICTVNIAAQQTKPTLQSVAFIAGCWEINVPAKKRFVSEQWMSPAGNAMIGMSRTIKADKMSGFEHLRIVMDDTGIYYISKPSENAVETSFKLVKWAANEVTFENPAHDFPQRIIYKLKSPNSLTPRIEGTAKVGTLDAIIPSIEGWARVTGTSTITIDDRDPYWAGFQVADR